MLAVRKMSQPTVSSVDGVSTSVSVPDEVVLVVSKGSPAKWCASESCFRFLATLRISTSLPGMASIQGDLLDSDRTE